MKDFFAGGQADCFSAARQSINGRTSHESHFFSCQIKEMEKCYSMWCQTHSASLFPVQTDPSFTDSISKDWFFFIWQSWDTCMDICMERQILLGLLCWTCFASEIEYVSQPWRYNNFSRLQLFVVHRHAGCRQTLCSIGNNEMLSILWTAAACNELCSHKHGVRPEPDVRYKCSIIITSHITGLSCLLCQMCRLACKHFQHPSST